ncbi:MAG: YraN family protein [Aeoliella sp.]
MSRWLNWLRRKPLPLGLRGERYAARWLRKLGYKIVAGGAGSNYGEIDLVAVDHETVVFVEVKTRQSHAMGHPAAAVDLAKQRHIVRTALAFLKEHHLLEYRARFDVVALTWPKGARRPRVEHIPNAFEPEDRGQFFV